VVAVRAYRLAAYTIPAPVTAFIYDTKIWDTQNAFNASTGVFTPPVAGKYKVIAQVVAQSTATAQWITIMVMKNGAQFSQNFSMYSNASGQWLFAQCVDTLDLVVGDTVSFSTQALAALAVNAAALNTHLAIDLISGTGPMGPTGAQGAPGLPGVMSFPLSDTAPSNRTEYQTNITGDTNPRFVIGADGTITWYNGASTGFNIGKITTDYANTGNLIISNQYGSVDVQSNLTAWQVGPDGNWSTDVMGGTYWIGAAAASLGNGPPVSASNSYQQGQIIMGRRGVGWFCIAGGSPGTWVPFGWGLPAPTASATTVSFTDPTGQVWVAKASVNGGAWARARDVLHTHVYRNAAFTFTAGAWANLTMDTTQFDDYGTYNTSTGVWTPAVPGIYQMSFILGGLPTATGQWVQGGIWETSPSVVVGDFLVHSSLAYAVISEINVTRRITSTADTYYCRMASGTALAGQPGTNHCSFQVDYIGGP